MAFNFMISDGGEVREQQGDNTVRFSTNSRDPCTSAYDMGLEKLTHDLEGIPYDMPVGAEASLPNEDVELLPTASQPRKPSVRFSKTAIKILKGWFHEHSEHPYPSEQTISTLKDMTGLKKSQINNWLANARRRQKTRSAPVRLPPLSAHAAKAIDIPGAGRLDHSDLNPMDRWKASPPENEAATMSDIARAVHDQHIPSSYPENTSATFHELNIQLQRSSSEDQIVWSNFRTPSESSWDTLASSQSSVSDTSTRSYDSRTFHLSSTDRRRRRKAPLRIQRASAVAARARSAKSAKRYQCTFCTDSFSTKYDWHRHEKSLHLALERWICCPSGGVIEVNGRRRCAFCPQVDPSEDHLEDHSFSACHAKTEHERTFYRKDHLRQHLRLTHECAFDPAMDGWKSMLTEIKSRCGFCDSTFTTWPQRVDHLAAHFRNGTDMSGWVGGWGFEPEVEAIVENAIPPYLIGHDRFSMNPYIARSSGNVGDAVPEVDRHPASTTIAKLQEGHWADGSNCWIVAREALVEFVSEQKAAGLTPTDRQLQDYARLAVYGDIDPLDWTCADYQAWLDAFKCEVGIGSCSPFVDVDVGATEDLATEVPRLQTARLHSSEAVTVVEPSWTHNTPAVLPLNNELGRPSLEQYNFDLNKLDLPTASLDLDRLDFSAANFDIDRPDFSAADFDRLDLEAICEDVLLPIDP